MKRIQTQEDLEAKKKRTKFIVGIVFIFMMVFSTAGFALYGRGGTASQEETPVNEDNPYFNGRYWQYTIQGQNFYFKNKPENVSEVVVDINDSAGEFISRNTYIDTNNEEFLTLIITNLGRYSPKMQKGCYGSCEEDIPERTCEGEDSLIVIRDSKEDKVYQEQNCIFIEGSDKSLDAFTYKILGVI